MTNLLEQIKKDMRVFDAQGRAIGRVESVQFGSGGTTVDEKGDVTPELPLTVTASRDSTDGSPIVLSKIKDDMDLPHEARRRLWMDGFVRVAGGVLRADRLILPDQIAGVDADGVRLKVTRGDLLKI